MYGDKKIENWYSEYKAQIIDTRAWHDVLSPAQIKKKEACAGNEKPVLR